MASTTASLPFSLSDGCTRDLTRQPKVQCVDIAGFTALGLACTCSHVLHHELLIHPTRWQPHGVPAELCEFQKVSPHTRSVPERRSAWMENSAHVAQAGAALRMKRTASCKQSMCALTRGTLPSRGAWCHCCAMPNVRIEGPARNTTWHRF